MGGGGFPQTEQGVRGRSQNAAPEPVSDRRGGLAQAVTLASRRAARS